MTKLDFATTKPKSTEANQETVRTEMARKTDEKESIIRDESYKKPTGTDLRGEIRLIDPIGMDWSSVLRISNIQAILSIMSIICLSSSMLLTGFNFYRFTSSAWSTYLFSCAYIGIRAGRWQSYAHSIAYCGMCTFQTFIYMSTMCWLLYSIYALNNQAQNYDFGHANDLALILTLGEVLAIIGTVITGVFGLIACCRGFGKLLHAQENMIRDHLSTNLVQTSCGRRTQINV